MKLKVIVNDEDATAVMFVKRKPTNVEMVTAAKTIFESLKKIGPGQSITVDVSHVEGAAPWSHGKRGPGILQTLGRYGCKSEANGKLGLINVRLLTSEEVEARHAVRLTKQAEKL